MTSNPPETPSTRDPQPGESNAPVASDEFALPPRRYTPTNRRATTAPTPRRYLLALVSSTLVAALFCLLYITKPVIIAPPTEVPQTVKVESREEIDTAPDPVGKPPAPPPDPPPAPPPDPEPPRETSTPTSATHDGYEETNLRVQHVLNASTRDGDLSRIVLDVPVIYASRNLRWTDAEVGQAREILNRLADYHEQSRRLRDLGTDILLDWNHLIERSIPTAELRADSPSLPANQEDAASLPRPSTLNTTESIEIRPSGP